MFRHLTLPLFAGCVALALHGCATSGAVPAPDTSAATATAGLEPLPLCSHGMPADECVRCEPSRADAFRARGDWCAGHAVPESHCRICHPELTFVRLPPVPEGADVKLISGMGEDVPALAAHAPAGKVVVFDFFAHWCAPCKQVEAHLHRLLQTRSDLAVRKLNVMNWESPLARRYLANVASLPYAVVLGRDGQVVRELVGLDLPALDAAIAEASAAPVPVAAPAAPVPAPAPAPGAAP